MGAGIVAIVILILILAIVVILIIVLFSKVLMVYIVNPSLNLL
jgi:hypothetical protein